MLACVLFATGEHLGVHLGYAARCVEQALAIRVFTQRGQEFAHGALGPRQIDQARGGQSRLS